MIVLLNLSPISREESELVHLPKFPTVPVDIPVFKCQLSHTAPKYHYLRPHIHDVLCFFALISEYFMPLDAVALRHDRVCSTITRCMLLDILQQLLQV